MEVGVRKQAGKAGERARRRSSMGWRADSGAMASEHPQGDVRAAEECAASRDAVLLLHTYDGRERRETQTARRATRAGLGEP